MYQTWFQFHGQPFPSAPKIDRYFAAPDAELVRQTLVQLVDLGSGPAVVIGSLGVGKTLMSQVLRRDLSTSRPVALVRGSCVHSRSDLIHCLAHEFQRPPRGSNEADERRLLLEFLKASAAAGRGAVLLMDEADRLNGDVWEELQALSQFCPDGQWGLQVVLFGTEGLEEALLAPALRSLHQRIARRLRLRPFTRQVTAEFIQYQLRRVALNPSQPLRIAPGTLQLIHELSGGVPRLIQQLGEHALILAAVAGTKEIDERLIQEAWSDLQQLPLSPSSNDPPPPSIAPGSPAADFIEFGSLDDTLPYESAGRLSPSATTDMDWAADSKSVATQMATRFAGIENDLEWVCRPDRTVRDVRGDDPNQLWNEAPTRPREAEAPPQNPREERSNSGKPRREPNPFLETFDEEFLVVDAAPPSPRLNGLARTSVMTVEGTALREFEARRGPALSVYSEVPSQVDSDTDLEHEEHIESEELVDRDENVERDLEIVTNEPIPLAAPIPEPLAEVSTSEVTPVAHVESVHRPRRFRRLFTRFAAARRRP